MGSTFDSNNNNKRDHRRILNLDATNVDLAAPLARSLTPACSHALLYFVRLVTMMISRDNINNYVRNLCSGDYLTVHLANFLIVCCICICICFALLDFFVQQCCDLCNCVCVSMPKCSEKVHRIDGHYTLCHSLLATVIVNNKKSTNQIKETLCVIYMEMNNYFDRSDTITNNIHIIAISFSTSFGV